MLNVITQGFNFRIVLTCGITYFIMIIFFSSCEETIDWELNPKENGKLVVEAILTDQLTIQEIRLSQSFNNLNGIAPSVNDATVIVSANQSFFQFENDDLEPGLYKSLMPFKVFSNLTYTLEIDWQGNNYSAESELSSVTPIPEITFQRSEDSTNLIFEEVPFIYNANQQSYYQ